MYTNKEKKILFVILEHIYPISLIKHAAALAVENSELVYRENIVCERSFSLTLMFLEHGVLRKDYRNNTSIINKNIKIMSKTPCLFFKSFKY